MRLPEDVLAFLRDAEMFRDERLGISPLTVDLCTLQTKQLREIDVPAELGLIVLDDANDSNPHCLITSGPAAGMVVHFCHDPEPVLRYPGLTHFLSALRTAHDQGLSLGQLPAPALEVHPDQTELVAHLRSYLGRKDEGASTLLHILYPLMDPKNIEILRETALHPDFLVRETAARFIAAHRHVAHREVAIILSSDAYLQVAEPAQQAVRAIADRLS